MIISFIERSWDEYNSWQKDDKKVFDKIQRLIKETLRDPFGGIGNPNHLKTIYKDIGQKESQMNIG